MKRRPSLLAALVVGALLTSTACKDGGAPDTEVKAKTEVEEPEPKAAEPKQVSVADAAAMFESKTAVFVDANGDDFRADNGVVPGAVLLASSSQYEVDKVLPADKNTALIFYCTSRT